MADAAATKKRPRVDLLASLDAAFAAKKAAPASKYTAQAAVKEAEANSQQAYLHKKRKNKGGKAPKGSNNQQQHGTGSNSTDTSGAGGSTNSINTSMKGQAASSDPLYAKLNVEILRVGLKNCSLVRTVHMTLFTLRRQPLICIYVFIVEWSSCRKPRH